MKNDLISRQAAIEALLTAAHINLSDGQAYFLEKALNEIPSAQPERKKGKWILFDLQDENEVANGNFYYVCSCCGKGDTHAKSAEVPYCWWCGARMRGEEDDD